jgi:hypothetical protein
MVDPQPSPKPDALTDRLYLLDMGMERFGDCLLGRFGEVTVLIDGGHPRDIEGRNGFPSIPEQLSRLLGKEPPFAVSLLVVTHAHSDHIGCLPALVREGLLRAEWALVADEMLGFGRPLDDGEDPVDLGASETARRLVAALREESRADDRSDALREFLSDAATLEPAYQEMLRTLEERGTRVVRYGRDDTAELVAAFASIGLKILGPSEDQLLICAEQIARLNQDALAAVADFTADSDVDEVALYRSLTARSFSDAADRAGRGAAVNNQSLVLRFEVRGRKLLLTGDMQLADPQMTGLAPYMDLLRGAIRAGGPYDFVKIAHHGSHNALDAAVLAELAGTRCFAISGGVRDKDHPDPEVLLLLKKQGQAIRWARTDRNGLITVALQANGIRLRTERGELNIAAANKEDQPTPAGPAVPSPAASPESAPPVEVFRRIEVGQDQYVEVVARVPNTATRVTLTIDVEPRTSSASHTDPARVTAPAFPRLLTLPELRIGGGRILPPLLFATSRQGLERNIGISEAGHLLETLREAGHTVVDSVPPGLADATPAAKLVRHTIDRQRHKGVVLLGGYDVVPSQRLDALDPGLRSRLPRRHRDADDFCVWSDEIYGDLNGDMLADIPVSRIPDGQSAALIFAAVQASAQGGRKRFGLRNVQRPFAQEIFDLIHGSEKLLVSEDTTSAHLTDSDLDADVVYLMLHGSDEDGTRFWGEDARGDLEAINIDNIPEKFSGVVFTGCCYGALCVDRPAVAVGAGQRPVPRAPRASMALSFLRAGARAFIGCTGTHYSPLDPPFSYYGAPLHKAFWRALHEGAAPAEALLLAKKEYLLGIPHGRGGAEDEAIERKILWQYVCLGLGW